MSDTYGTEPHDHEEDLTEVLPEHDIVPEAPSRHEFSDDFESHSATVDADSGEDHESLPVDEAAPPRRSPLVPVAAAAGVLLLLGAVAWWQFGGASSPSQQFAEAPAHPLVLSSAPASVPDNKSPAPSAPPSDIAANNDVAPRTAMDSASVTPAVVPAPVDGAATSAVIPPAAPAMPVSAQPAVVNVNPAASSAPVTAAPAAPAGRLDALAARVDALQKSLDQDNQQLSQITNMVGAIASQPSASKDVQDRLDKIEQQVAQLNHPAPALAAPAPMGADAGLVAVPVAAPVAKTIPHHTTASKTKTAHKEKATHKVATKQPNPSKSAPSKWVLRAAMPGQAWVAESASSHDLRQVQVGDTLPGIGKVMAIQTVGGGSWVVRGAHGSIE